MELLRVFFSKMDEASYISHLDLQRVMARALRRSGLPVWYSQGFNPHIYMSFSLPLPLMQHSIAESVDCKTEAENVNYPAFVGPLNAALPRGITVSRIAKPVHKAEDIQAAEYRISWPEEHRPAVVRAAALYAETPEVLVVRKTKRSEQQVDLKQQLPALDVTEDGRGFAVRLPAGGQLNYNPDLLLGFLDEQVALPRDAAHVLRTRVLTNEAETFS